MNADAFSSSVGPVIPRTGGERIVVIGAGHAAGRLVERLRAFGHTGDIILVGGEPHLPYERPYLSKAMLSESKEPMASHLLAPELFADSKTQHMLGQCANEVDLVARRVHTSTGEPLSYDILVFATGLAPRRLSLLDEVGVFAGPLQTLDEARALRLSFAEGRPVALIGAGFIGLEVASSARSLGLDVHVIDLAEYPLGRTLPPILGAALADLHRAGGSQLHMGRQIVKAESGPLTKLHLDSGAILEVGTIVLGMGGVPRDELARDAGLLVDDGIIVDATGRTSDNAVFAIGDVARRILPEGGTMRLESWRNAEDTGAATAAAITGQTPLPAQAAPWFWTDQLGRQIQILGQPHPNSAQFHTGTPFEAGYVAFFVHDGQLRQVVAVDAPHAIRAGRSIFRKGGSVAPDELAALGLTRLEATAPAGGDHP